MANDTASTTAVYVITKYQVTAYPRSKENLFTYVTETDKHGKKTGIPKIKDYKTLKPYLENFSGQANQIKDIENRMYLDLCRHFPENSGSLYCAKKVSILVQYFNGKDYSPYAPNDKILSKMKLDHTIEITRESGSDKTKFYSPYAGHNKLEEQVSISAQNLDSCGLMEFYVVHPVKDVTDKTLQISIKLKGKSGNEKNGGTTSLSLILLRDEAVSDLRDIESGAKADKILIFQQFDPKQKTPAVAKLRALCNEVIPRTCGIRNYEIIDENDMTYSSDLKAALSLYMNYYRDNSESPWGKTGYPFGVGSLKDFGIDKDLAQHITDEYGINYKKSFGIVVDQHLPRGNKSGGVGILDLNDYIQSHPGDLTTRVCDGSVEKQVNGNLYQLDLEGPCYIASLQGIAESFAHKNMRAKDKLDSIQYLKNINAINGNYTVADDAKAALIIKDALQRLKIPNIEALNIEVCKIGEDGEKAYLDTKERATDSVRHVSSIKDSTTPAHFEQGDKKGDFVWDPISGITTNGRTNFPDDTRYAIIGNFIMRKL
jgi:hypothetical protein